MSEALNPNGNPVRVGQVRLRTPGLAGSATAYAPAAAETRGVELTTEALDAALARAAVEPQETIAITDTREVDVGAVPTRSTTFGKPAFELEVQDPGAAWGQFVLYTDEAGVTTFNFARDAENRIDTTRGGETRTYVIRRYVAPPSAAPETRGLIGALGSKVLKVLVFPMIDPVLGEVGDFFASRWEQRNRPYRIRRFDPDNFDKPDAPPVEGADWDRLAGGRALLFVHGTFSRAHGAFGALPDDYFAELYRRYEGRVFAFDHFTISDDPKRNVAWLVEHIPDGARLDLDIVCHSRGGLVSRVLAEKQGELSLGSRELRVKKIVFLAAPNAGTVLTDTQHLDSFISSYTNLLNFFPDAGITDLLEAIITIAKQLAAGAVKGLEGLQSMLPNGTFLHDWLNTGPRGAERYFAAAANFEPVDAGLAAWARDALMDEIFQADNDLVVPTAGVYDQNGCGLFPIEERLVFGPTDGVHHNAFVRNAVTRQQMLAWLSA